ncbi:uncharacterized protein EV420DRAFT_345841 [Desarmillaria tabescens]|uniref:Uncharacterized protein n=1 Tax=Armillaria tabescens TaxID=1929756 RepID=A0AA39N5M4_ARMTA|nr:uncharacterized protein EV420DRAFT_345841 [Desarmillaria tabescens]KAK0459016.1 hypothetical protein EV420DRAFT_345841 [Desarmillaria tabescens]
MGAWYIILINHLLRYFCSPMAIRVDISSDLTNDDKTYMFQFLDANLNSGILYALLHGIYTGILAVTLWNIFINKSWPIRRAMVAVIILLYTLITISFGARWSLTHFAFIDDGQSFWTVYLNLVGTTQAFYWETSITASISTILTDLYMIWCCWMVWGRRWLVILLPMFSLASAIASKIITVYHDYFDEPAGVFLILYISSILATTLTCTLLIIYRIITITGVCRGAEGRLKVYHHFVEVLVESSALYSITLILFLAFIIRNHQGQHYLDVAASIAKGISPTLLVGRITAGRRARPDDSWQESVMASASIMPSSQEHSRTSSQEVGPTSSVLDNDLEAQRGSSVRVD